MDFRTAMNEEAAPEQGRGEESMSMLSTMAGNESVSAEGEPLGMDGVAGKAKLSTSTLAIGVVVVLGAATLFGMKLSLGNAETDEATASAIAEIDTFITQIAEAEKHQAQGPISSTNKESEKVFEQLRQDPTQHQVPPEQVEKNPFELVGVEIAGPDKPLTGPDGPSPEQLLERDRTAAKAIKINTIMNGREPMVFINSEQYRVGDTIGTTIFSIHAIEDLSIIVRSSVSNNLLRIRYE